MIVKSDREPLAEVPKDTRSLVITMTGKSEISVKFFLPFGDSSAHGLEIQRGIRCPARTWQLYV